MTDATSDLNAIVEAELDRPVPPAVAAIADVARAEHGDAIVAVLFYGSCFRDGQVEDRLVDFYLLADDYRRAHASRLSALANRLLPPNVYYVETVHEGAIVRAKYALVTLARLERKVARRTLNPYFWARFAQPAGLVWARDAAIRARVAGILCESIKTTYAAALALTRQQARSEALWTSIFQATYRTELRAEKPHRAVEIYRSFAERYDRLSAALERAGVAPAPRSWALARLQGKALSVARLVKAAFTFKGGADYLVWKIARHSGVKVEISDWQRRHPVLAAPPILYRLWRAKAVR